MKSKLFSNKMKNRTINILSSVFIVLSVGVLILKATGGFINDKNSLFSFFASTAMLNTKFGSDTSNDIEKFNMYKSDKSNLEELKFAYDRPAKEISIPTENKITLSPELGCPTADIGEGETAYKVIERNIGNDGTEVNNFYVKNTSGIDVDFAKELETRPDVNIRSTSEPQVLISHTHTSEAYIDKDTGQYPASFYPRSSNPNCSVVAVGNAIKKQLDKNGINTIHDTTIHDSPSYTGAYQRSEQTVKNNLNKYPGIQVALDIHRDAIGNDETGRTKPTFTYNSKKAAQAMIIAGCDPDGSWDFPDWEQNLRLALRIQQKAEEMYPGMMRPIKFFESQYNMELTHGSLLIEVGTDVNTVEEATYSGELLGNAISAVLSDLKVQ